MHACENLLRYRKESYIDICNRYVSFSHGQSFHYLLRTIKTTTSSSNGYNFSTSGTDCELNDLRGGDR